MSASPSMKNRAQKTGMKARKGPSQTYMNVESNGKYARGAKKGLRRARRRTSKNLTDNPDLE